MLDKPQADRYCVLESPGAQRHLLGGPSSRQHSCVAAILTGRLIVEADPGPRRKRLVPVHGYVGEVAENGEAVGCQENAPALLVVPVSDRPEDWLMRRAHEPRRTAPTRRAKCLHRGSDAD